MPKEKSISDARKYIKLNRDDLIPYANNPRTHSESQVNQIAASIREFGFVVPVIVDEDHGIIAGHGRILAAKKLNLEIIPCIMLSGLSKAQKKAYIIADNQLPMNADWIFEMLKIEIDGLEEMDFDINLLGFDDSFLDGLLQEETEGLTDEDAVPEAPETPISVLGDLWILGNHRLLCGDSTSIDAVDKLMDGVKIDIVLTDPPYGMNLDTDYSKMPSTKASGNKYYKPIIGDNIKFNYQVFSWIDCDEQVWFGANYYAKTIEDDGSWLVWDKRVEEKFDRMFGSGFELAWSKKKHKQKIYRYNNTLFGGDIESRNKVHPTQKPTSLIVEILEDFKSGDVVLDLFLGSGSTLIACEQLNRQCYGMELDPKYCDVIIRRWQEFTGQEAIHENGQTFNSMSEVKGAE